MRIDNPQINNSDSNINTGIRRNITKATKSGWNEQLWIADGKLYCSKAGHGNVSYSAVSSNINTAPNTFRRGIEQMWEVLFPPTETGKVVDADVFAQSAWALLDNGDLYTWGRNQFGQLGLGDTDDRFSPTLSNIGVTKVYTHSSNSHRTGSYTRLYCLRGGELFGCGYNEFGQLGDGTTTNRSSWTRITLAGVNPKSVWNLGGYTGCLIVQKSDNVILASGYNGWGQLGNNTTTNITTLTNVSNAWSGNDNTMVIQDVQGGFGYNDTANGYEHCNITMFLDNGTTSRIVGAGANNWSTIGDNTTTQRNVPTVPTGFTGRIRKMVRVGDGPGSIHVLKTDGTLWNWGYNGYGQIGNGTTPNRTIPAQAMAGVEDIYEHNVAGQTLGYVNTSPVILKTDGSYWISGDNEFGQLADGTLTRRTSFVQMWFPNGTKIKHFATSNSTTYGTVHFAVTEDNRIYGYGYNEIAAIHEDNFNNCPLPILVNPPVLQR